jgi:hypothetical protein
MADQEVILRVLTANERIALQAGLDTAARLLDATLPLSGGQVQALYDLLLESDHDPDHQIAAGLAFGDLIAREPECEWARIEDEYGSETCVAVIGRMTNCAPISMIQKRIRRNENVDISELRDGTLSMLRNHAAGAQVRGTS